MTNEEKRHAIKHFINKFEATREEEWCTGSFHYLGRHCALGHLGARNDFSSGHGRVIHTQESEMLCTLFGGISNTMALNDSHHSPRGPVIAALHDKLKEVL